MIEPGAVHAGRYDGDDVEAVAAALKEAASRAEVDATPLVLSVAAATGGVARRLDTRLKSRESILEKLGRFRGRRTPQFRLERFNDALRYTIVYPDLIYWRAVRASQTALDDHGCEVRTVLDRWGSDNYRGINMTVRDPAGFDFEIQLHTEVSLAAAEQTHPSYEEERKHHPRSARAQELRTSQSEVWELVPVPPGAPEVHS
ncbi:MAG: hypothetical protein QM655_02150 [Nocardioidaceae bacterium]